MEGREGGRETLAIERDGREGRRVGEAGVSPGGRDTHTCRRKERRMKIEKGVVAISRS